MDSSTPNYAPLVYGWGVGPKNSKFYPFSEYKYPTGAYPLHKIFKKYVAFVGSITISWLLKFVVFHWASASTMLSWVGLPSYSLYGKSSFFYFLVHHTFEWQSLWTPIRHWCINSFGICCFCCIWQGLQLCTHIQLCLKATTWHHHRMKKLQNMAKFGGFQIQMIWNMAPKHRSA